MLSQLFPIICVLCRRPVRGETLFCPGCLQGLQLHQQALCLVCDEDARTCPFCTQLAPSMGWIRLVAFEDHPTANKLIETLDRGWDYPLGTAVAAMLVGRYQLAHESVPERVLTLRSCWRSWTDHRLARQVADGLGSVYLQRWWGQPGALPERGTVLVITTKASLIQAVALLPMIADPLRRVVLLTALGDS